MKKEFDASIYHSTDTAHGRNIIGLHPPQKVQMKKNREIIRRKY